MAGLSSGRVSLEDIENRRFQLWALMTTLLVSASMLVALASLWSVPASLPSVTAGVLPVGMALLSLAFSAYVWEKELALRRLTRALVDEQRLRTALERQVSQLHRLVEAERAVTATLELERVVDLVLENALELFGATTGTVHLMGREGLKLAGRRGPVSDGPLSQVATASAREVASSQRALLVPGTSPSPAHSPEPSMVVPLLHEGTLVGVLTICPANREVGDVALSILEAFAEHAAAALANAIRYEEERATAGWYRELEAVREEFRWLTR